MNRIFTSSQFLCLLMLPVFLLPLAGCGDGRPARVPVSGQVLVDGRPLTTGSIRVVPSGARAAQGTIGEDGRFTLTTYEEGDGCVQGTHRVEVTAIENVDQLAHRLIPEKYGDVATSDLTVTIDGPTDSLVIELTGGAEARPSEALDGTGDVDPAAE